MAYEAAADVGVIIAHHVREARQQGAVPQALNEAVDRLMVASGTTSLDALTFLAVARQILRTFVPMLPIEADGVQELSVAASLIHRAVQALEAETGYGAEGFTGEINVVN